MAAHSIINDIYQQFIDYFGEDRVDLVDYDSRNLDIDTYGTSYAGCKVILVHWPTVTVENEYEEKVDIWDLYAATIIGANGRLMSNPLFNRSTYDSIQWRSGYAHSHLSGINKNNIRLFRTSCLGSGPINGTIRKLSNSYCTDMDIWNLYIWELDKYVHVESIAGVPYRKIRNIGVTEDGAVFLKDFPIVCHHSSLPSGIPLRIIQEITKILLDKKVFSFAYQKGRYFLGMSFVNAVMDASNAFIDYYNSNPAFRKKYSKSFLTSKKIITTYILKGEGFYDPASRYVPIEAIVGREMFKFKGEMVKLTLKDFHAVYTTGEVNVINISLLGYIIYNVLKYINVKYGGTKNNTAEKVRII